MPRLGSSSRDAAVSDLLLKDGGVDVDPLDLLAETSRPTNAGLRMAPPSPGRKQLVRQQDQAAAPRPFEGGIKFYNGGVEVDEPLLQQLTSSRSSPTESEEGGASLLSRRVHVGRDYAAGIRYPVSQPAVLAPE